LTYKMLTVHIDSYCWHTKTFDW